MSDELAFTVAGASYRDLRSGVGLYQLDEQFKKHVAHHGFQSAFDRLRSELELSREEHSALILLLAPELESFLIEAMGYQSDMQPYREKQKRYHQIQQFKRTYLLRRIKPQLTRLEPKAFEILSEKLWQRCNKGDWEFSLSQWANESLEANDAEALSLLESWCVSACLTEDGQAWVAGSVLFDWPKRTDKESLIQAVDHHRCREGFDLQDQGLSEELQNDHAHYCLDCHQKSGDFCSIGFPVKKGDMSKGYRTHVSGELMLGCPLEEHVGEMHELFAAGHPIAALAAAMVNNPLIALTGHRVCNDCMKSCVYQKQDPVNTPGVESGLLKWALHLPFGVELIGLLMRWNPLRFWQPIEKPTNNRSVAVMGLGPAGIAMMHHLLMEGCTVVGFDGAPLMPVPQTWCDAPILNYESLCSPLSERPARGFGGVSEYGITVRWDKNLLTLLHVLYQRHPRVTLIGSVRFGGTLGVESFWPLGFDHLCLAVGAGLPKELRIPNSLAIGMRQASDFLMSIQQSSASDSKGLGLFQMRLPVLVIGGGLTAVDAATEAMAHYLQLIQLVSQRYHALCDQLGESVLRSQGTISDWEIIDEWLMHAAEWDSEKRQAEIEKRQPDTVAFLNRYGGVSIVYRRSMKESPAYRRNHEELAICLESGVSYHESLQPESVVCDDKEHVRALRCQPVDRDEEGHLVPVGDFLELPARCVLTATGAKPNVAYEFEHRGSFKKHNGFYTPYRWGGHSWEEDRSEGHFKHDDIGMLTSYEHEGHRVSLVGDTHWRYQGTVVQAIASARKALPQIMRSLSHLPVSKQALNRNELIHSFQVRVLANTEVSDNVHELTLSCPQIASRHKAGQFYRLKPVGLGVESAGVALLGSSMANQGCLSFLLTGDSPSLRLLQQLKPGDACDLMGPTGAWAHQPDNPESVLVIGDMLAVAFLRSVSPEWQEKGHCVSWWKTRGVSIDERYLPNMESVEELSDDLMLSETFQKAAKHFSAVYVIGKADLVRAVRKARANAWGSHFSDSCRWVGAVYGPMQCQLKGVCAQCLQWQIDPNTGERTKAVYACSWQHQPMNIIDLKHLSMRQTQSRAIDFLTQRWFEEIVSHAL